eukprot:Nitzschia sp. Nitz4//scaffold376_size14603//8852//10148//NITZ4_008921-RA/size14603-augustus-gene-0.17-mRNA-1//-1//CDS//3329549661//2213//frame0
MATSEDKKLTEAERNLQGDAPVYKFVITGGPCGGKTTALARIFSYLRERGFEVITCPEVFTILASNGMSLDFYSTEGIATVIQNTVLDVHLSMADNLEQVLKARGKPGVLLCDRGPMDGAAYLSEAEWNALLDARGLDVTDFRDKRYNAVFHMVTAADGASAHYTLENNQVRSETPEQAIDLDRRTRKAWVGHPHFHVFDNSTDFEGKLQRLIDRISGIVGLPTNLSRRSAKFLLRSRPDTSLFPADVAYHVFEVEKVYLVNQDEDEANYSFIRKRTTIDKMGNRRGEVYQLTNVQKTSDGEIVEHKRIITAREYSASYKSRDTSRHIILQERISFLYNLQSFTIHVFQTPQASEGLCILHAQVECSPNEEPEVMLPPFLEIDRRLQGPQDESDFGAYSLSIIR